MGDLLTKVTNTSRVDVYQHFAKCDTNDTPVSTNEHCDELYACWQKQNTRHRQKIKFTQNVYLTPKQRKIRCGKYTHQEEISNKWHVVTTQEWDISKINF